MARGEEGARNLQDRVLGSFLEGLAEAFLGAGEAKWWDAQCAVMMDEAGRAHGVCGLAGDVRTIPGRVLPLGAQP